VASESAHAFYKTSILSAFRNALPTHGAYPFSLKIFAKRWVELHAEQRKVAICIQIKNLNDEILVGGEPTSI